MHIYNSLTREKELFQPINEGEVKIYTCGPTIYHYVHIGNLRTFVFEDLLCRTLRYYDYKVTQVMNLTDVDDKTIKGAIQEKVSLNTFTKKYKDAFFEDLNALHIEPAAYYPAATDYIQEMIDMIAKLLEKGMAYKGGDGSVYYPIAKFEHYGCLSHFKMDELQSGASKRHVSDEYEKDHVADFVLWKGYDETRDGAIYWESPYGKGRPGWHLECSAMAMSILGETIDIHMGGVDNMFPHHENEIAQSEACSGKKFVNYWMHAEHLVVDGKKMSKSLGNFFTLRDLLAKGYSGIEVRYMLLQTHYKTQLNFTLAGLEAVKGSLQRLQDFIYRLQNLAEEASSNEVKDLLAIADEEFAKGLADDLNISHSLASLFDLVREVNARIDQKKVNTQEANEVLVHLERYNEVLALLDFKAAEPEISQDVQQLFADRMAARQAKDWALADALRGQISEKGYIIEDSPQGARLKKI
jgi:cysteinyl-tRNA synthetase